MTDRRTTGNGDRSSPESFTVRTARGTDAGEAAAVLRASITRLCIADHGNEPDVVADWLENKTARNVGTWIRESGRVVIAEGCGRIVGVGAASASGEITLNYVLPEARFRGVSKAMLDVLEAYLAATGHAQCSLHSTRTAYRFYRRWGYADAGEPLTRGRLTCIPMIKVLSR